MTEVSSDVNQVKDLTVLQEVLKEKPEDIGSYSRLGWALYSLQKFDEAASTFRSAFERWPADIEINYGLGMALKMLGDKQEALESFKRAETSEPESVRAGMMQTLAVEQKEYLLQKI
jgi:tetratricopeptide (TPR) repeat protein